jgi:DNA polymerase-3 subunit alpha
MVTHLHVHSEYSQLDGLSTTREIAERCQEIGCDAVGLSDHGTVAGHLDFGKTMLDHDIKPIFACELYHGVKTQYKRNERDQAHFLAGALTSEGLRNLWRLVDASADYFRWVGRVNWDTLEKYSEGLFATSACIQGLVSRELSEGRYDALNRYLDIFGDNFYIELHAYPSEAQEQMNLALVQVATERGIPVVCACDAHYARPDQYEYHDSYVALSTGDSIYTDPSERKMWHPLALYLQDENEVRVNLDYLPYETVNEAIDNSVRIGEMANARLPEVKRHLPMFVPADCPWLDSDEDPKLIFIDLVEAGLRERYGEDASDEVWERAERELKVFLDAGLEHYFLQTWDFCRFCDEEGIQRGPGRGSAGGAIVSYALRITDIDPLYYGLVFERFYNPGREKGFPDVDNDFPRKARPKVREYLENRWGKQRVRPIGTINRMKPKAACDRMWKACDITWNEKEELKDILDKVPDIDILGPDSIGWNKNLDPGKTVYVNDHVYNEIEHWITKQPSKRQELIHNWIALLEYLCSRVENYGIHPSGIVISEVDLDGELPSRRAVDTQTDEEMKVTVFPMKDVDARQFVKQDVLGLRNLDTLEEWERQIGSTVPWSGLEREKHPEEMWEMLHQGLTLGIFQIEDGYGRHLCKELKPQSVEDLGVIVALNRPGPIRSGVPENYIRRHKGEIPDERDLPILRDLLKPTHGLFVYQEQVIDFFAAIGYDLSEADDVRKILGKKKPEQMKALLQGTGEWTGRAYEDMARSAGLNRDEAEWVWKRVEDFALYSFNKSHAIEYGTLAFRTLYAKYTAPPEYLISCIRTNPKRAGEYVAEGRRLGISVLPPDIARSKADITVVDGDILFGFANVKHIGLPTAEYLCELRDRHDITGVEKLYEAIEAEWKIWDEADKETRGRSPRQKFRQSNITHLFNAGAFDDYEERSLTLVQQQQLEKELLQVILTDTSQEILDRHADLVQECDGYGTLSNGSQMKVPGIVSHIKRVNTKKGKRPMGIVTIEHGDSEAEFVVFPDQWKGYSFLWKERTPGIFTLKQTDRGLHLREAIRLT